MIRFIAMLFTITVIPRVGTASHYGLDQIDLVEPDILDKLSAMKILTTEDLFNRTDTAKKRAKLVKALKVPEEKVMFWAEFCDLLRIEGIGPKVARVLLHSGIHSTKDLARSDPKQLLEGIIKANKEIEVLGKIPDIDTVNHWISLARSLQKRKKP
jgi:predicted flap endonuclease-1-like 5' DNA nuclease